MFTRRNGLPLTDQHKSFILSKMKSAGSLQYVADILTNLNDELLSHLDVVEVELGKNSLLRAMIIAVRM